VYFRGSPIHRQKPLLTQAEVSNCMDCRRGYRRVNLCVREDIYRALRFLEASSGLRRFEIINEALELYLLNYNTIKRLGPEGVKKALEGRT